MATRMVPTVDRCECESPNVVAEHETVGTYPEVLVSMSVTCTRCNKVLGRWKDGLGDITMVEDR